MTADGEAAAREVSAPGHPEAHADDVDFAADAPQAADSDSDSSDGLPPLDSYWAAKLNVTKTGAPLPPPKMLSPEELAREREKERQAKAKTRGWGDGSRGKGEWKGKGAWGGKGWKGGKGDGKQRSNDIGAFVAWARNPFAEDGARRARSRSPRRQAKGGGGLEDFMSWAREEPEAEGRGDPASGAGVDTGLGGFLEWASHAEPARASGRRASAGSRAPRDDDAEIPAVKAQPKEEPAAEPVAPQQQQELIVPPELRDELRAVEEAAAGASGAPPRSRRRNREDESDDDSGDAGARR